MPSYWDTPPTHTPEHDADGQCCTQPDFVALGRWRRHSRSKGGSDNAKGRPKGDASSNHPTCSNSGSHGSECKSSGGRQARRHKKSNAAGNANDMRHAASDKSKGGSCTHRQRDAHASTRRRSSPHREPTVVLPATLGSSSSSSNMSSGGGGSSSQSPQQPPPPQPQLQPVHTGVVSHPRTFDAEVAAAATPATPRRQQAPCVAPALPPPPPPLSLPAHVLLQLQLQQLQLQQQQQQQQQQQRVRLPMHPCMTQLLQPPALAPSWSPWNMHATAVAAGAPGGAFMGGRGAVDGGGGVASVGGGGSRSCDTFALPTLPARRACKPSPVPHSAVAHCPPQPPQSPPSSSHAMPHMTTTTTTMTDALHNERTACVRQDTTSAAATTALGPVQSRSQSQSQSQPQQPPPAKASPMLLQCAQVSTTTTCGNTNVDSSSSSSSNSSSHDSDDASGTHRSIHSNSNHSGGSPDSVRDTSCVDGSSLMLDATTQLPSVCIVHALNAYEEDEVRGYYPNVYFTGTAECVKVAGQRGLSGNDGYDDADGYYRLALGDHIAYRYEVVKELGRGTFGVVVKAYDHKRGGYVALKLIRNRPAYLRQAREEVRLLTMLRDNDVHDVANVVHMHTSFMFRNHCVLVFELLVGDLYSLMQARKFAPFRMRTVRDFAQQMLVALDFVRAHNIIHCDIKPENVALCQLPPPPPTRKDGVSSLSLLPSAIRRNVADGGGDGGKHGSGVRYKLIDFGSACVSNAQLYTYIQSRYYRAPEVVLGVAYTMAIDMWSFGCVLCELVNGRPIFPASSDADLLDRIAEYLGECPYAMRVRGRRSAQFFGDDGTLLPLRPRGCGNAGGANGKASSTGAARRVPRSRSLHAFLGTSSDSECDCAFVSFVSGCLAYEPEERMTPAQALQHPWLRQYD